MAKKKELDALVELINNFDTYYEMSDDAKVINQGSEEQAVIQTQVDYISEEERDYILLHLTKVGKENYDRYFNTEENDDNLGVAYLNF